jgi:hypothetical protein
MNVAKKTSSFVKSGNVGTANVGFSISGFHSAVEPSLFFNNSEKVLNGLVSVGSGGSNFGEFKTYSSESFVKGLFDEDIGS